MSRSFGYALGRRRNRGGACGGWEAQRVELTKDADEWLRDVAVDDELPDVRATVEPDMREREKAQVPPLHRAARPPGAVDEERALIRREGSNRRVERRRRHGAHRGRERAEQKSCDGENGESHGSIVSARELIRTTRRMRVLVLQHIACEPPGVFEDVLHERDAELHQVKLDEGEPLPDWRAFDAIVAMGGPMSVNDEAELPVARRREAHDRRSCSRGQAVLGRLPRRPASGGLASGRACTRAREPEVGLLPVVLTERGSRRSGVRPGATTSSLRFSGTATRSTSRPAPFASQGLRHMRIKRSASNVRMASSSIWRSQARWHASGPRFPRTSHRSSARSAPYGAPAFLAEIEQNANAMRLEGRALFERWLDRVALAA